MRFKEPSVNAYRSHIQALGAPQAALDQLSDQACTSLVVPSEGQTTLLHFAARSADLTFFKNVLSRYPVLLNGQDDEGLTPIAMVVAADQVDMLHHAYLQNQDAINEMIDDVIVNSAFARGSTAVLSWFIQFMPALVSDAANVTERIFSNCHKPHVLDKCVSWMIDIHQDAEQDNDASFPHKDQRFIEKLAFLLGKRLDDPDSQRIHQVLRLIDQWFATFELDVETFSDIPDQSQQQLEALERVYKDFGHCVQLTLPKRPSAVSEDQANDEVLKDGVARLAQLASQNASWVRQARQFETGFSALLLSTPSEGPLPPEVNQSIAAYLTPSTKQAHVSDLPFHFYSEMWCALCKPLIKQLRNLTQCYEHTAAHNSGNEIATSLQPSIRGFQCVLACVKAFADVENYDGVLELETQLTLLADRLANDQDDCHAVSNSSVIEKFIPEAQRLVSCWARFIGERQFNQVPFDEQQSRKRPRLHASSAAIDELPTDEEFAAQLDALAASPPSLSS